MSPIFIIMEPDILGGTATLSIRLGRELVKRRYKVLYVCDKIDDINNVNSMKNEGIEVCCWKQSDICNNLISRYGERGCYYFLTYRLNEFLLAETLKNRLKIEKNILYIVHHYALVRGTNKNIIIRRIVKTFYKKFIDLLIKHHNIIFMDAISIEETEKHYSLNLDSARNFIFNLPIEPKNLNMDTIDQKHNAKTFNLLTITRADFPFKGYVIGLINDFEKMCSVYNDVNLTIIAFGQDRYKIEKKVNELSICVRKKINLIGQTPYEKLSEYFDKSHLYLGMGTTLLDAVNHGVPALAVQHYTYENYVSGFFYMQPNLLVCKPNIMNSALPYIENVKIMNKEEYMNLCKKEHDTLLKHYNIELLANYLVDKNNIMKTKKANCFYMIIHKLFCKMLDFVKV